MSIFKGLFKVALSPLSAVKEVIDDVSGENGENEQGLSIITIGVSSAVKGAAKGIKNGIEEIFD